MTHAEFPEKLTAALQEPVSKDQESHKHSMPDVASLDSAEVAGKLRWVGMSEIALPFAINDLQQGETACQGKVGTWVSLDQAQSKGIHMSRLFLLLESFFQTESLSPDSAVRLLQQQLQSHEGLSESARLTFNFDLMLKRSALKSGFSGWKSYPVVLDVELADTARVDLTVVVPYSSTCPCSASLSRQLTEQAMQAHFEGQETLSKDDVSQWLLSPAGSFATPHSQRSLAEVTVRLSANEAALPITVLIDQIEGALKTPVQTAVKREDEQEFARLNGHNLMFCEDAARRIQASLNDDVRYTDFCLKVEHQESLHAHNAVAMADKGISHGLRAR